MGGSDFRRVVRRDDARRRMAGVVAVKWTPHAVPPTVEALAHRLALACGQLDVAYCSVVATDGKLTGITLKRYGEDDYRSLCLIGGEWCELGATEDGEDEEEE